MSEIMDRPHIGDNEKKGTFTPNESFIYKDVLEMKSDWPFDTYAFVSTLKC